MIFHRSSKNCVKIQKVGEKWIKGSLISNSVPIPNPQKSELRDEKRHILNYQFFKFTELEGDSWVFISFYLISLAKKTPFVFSNKKHGRNSHFFLLIFILSIPLIVNEQALVQIVFPPKDICRLKWLHCPITGQPFSFLCIYTSKHFKHVKSNFHYT